MRYLVGQTTMDGKICWQDTSHLGGQQQPSGLKINFPYHSRISQFDAMRFLEEGLSKNEIKWLYRDRQGWRLNSDLFKDNFEGFREENWLKGILSPLLEIEHNKETVFNRERDRTFCRFIITPDMVDDQMPKRIFLSHKGINKPIVRSFKIALEAIGLSPWLDEDAMHAGVELERGILQGFEDSCAAVFFITKDFKDEKYLASEVNYAIAEKRTKGSRFSIITLVFREDSADEIKVPGLLKSYVWKEPTSEINAFAEIVRALPINVGELGWR